jgi:hypothetical protein
MAPPPAPVAKVMLWLDRCASLAVLPCLAVLWVGVCRLSLPILWSAVAGIGTCVMLKLIAFATDAFR